MRKLFCVLTHAHCGLVFIKRRLLLLKKIEKIVTISGVIEEGVGGASGSGGSTSARREEQPNKE